MKRFIAALVVAACVWSNLAHAQVDMTVTTDRKIYLPYEPITLVIGIKNSSGNALSIKEWKDGFVNCEIQDVLGRTPAIYPKLLQKPPANATSQMVARVNLAMDLELPAGAKLNTKVRLNNFYALAAPGNYQVRVRFSHRRLPMDLLSKPISLTVKRGTEIMSRHVGLPVKDDENIKMRKVTLLDFRAEKMKYCCLQIEDDRMVYALIRLSPRSAADKPTIEVDALSNLHILMHTKPKIFSYWIFDLQGQVKEETHYQVIGKQKPKLVRDPDIGRVMIQGGRRLIPGTDTGLELPSYKAPR